MMALVVNGIDTDVDSDIQWFFLKMGPLKGAYLVPVRPFAVSLQCGMHCRCRTNSVILRCI